MVEQCIICGYQKDDHGKDTRACREFRIADRECRHCGALQSQHAIDRRCATVGLSAEALARLDAIAAERGQTRSGVVEQLVRNARLRETDSR